LELLGLLIQNQQQQRMKLLKELKPLAVSVRKGFYFALRFLFNLPPYRSLIHSKQSKCLYGVVGHL
jgi:hypothetical protein